MSPDRSRATDDTAWWDLTDDAADEDANECDDAEGDADHDWLDAEPEDR